MPPDLEGTWRPLRAELNGELAPGMALEKMAVVLSAGAYHIEFGGERSDEGSYSVSVENEQIALTLRGTRGVNAGREIPCIAQLRGDRLRICYGLDGVRPDAFTAGPGSSRYLVVYRRS